MRFLIICVPFYHNFLSLLETKYSKTESFKNFESRFSAQMSRYNAHRRSIELSVSILWLLFLNNAILGDSKRVPILSSLQHRQPHWSQVIARTKTWSSSSSINQLHLLFGNLRMELRQTDKVSGLVLFCLVKLYRHIHKESLCPVQTLTRTNVRWNLSNFALQTSSLLCSLRYVWPFQSWQ